MNQFKISNTILVFLILYVVIGLYFFHFKTETIYGDDLFLYRDHFDMKNMIDVMNVAKINEKFRPVWGIVLNFIINSFHAAIYKYYLFNVGIQAINSCILAIILNLFLKSPFFSTVVSLLFGLSRFALFNITQVCCGGALEGLAMTFFLLSLYYIFCFFIKDENSSKQNFLSLVYVIICSNLAMDTHERYIVLFPFIILIALLHPIKNKLSRRQKIFICSLAILSMVMNILIKKYVYGYPFFVGTGGTYIKPSFESITGYLSEALLSIIQINSGGESLIGIPYKSLNPFYQGIVVVILILLLIILFYYYASIRDYFKSKQGKEITSLHIITSLLILFILCLIPAIVTIRVEQRWLQAPFSVFILIVVIAFCNINARTVVSKNVLFSLFIVLFLFSDFHYLKKTSNTVFIKSEEHIATIFKQAIYNGTINKRINNLYIEEQKKGDEGYEFNIRWALAFGYNFQVYQGKSKNIIFLDSLKFTDSTQINLLKNFNKETDQVISVQDKIVVVTDQYLEEKLKRQHKL